MQLRVPQPFRDHLGIFPLKALKNEIFLLLAQISHLYLPKICQARQNINYFSEKYMKRQIRPKRFKALAVILKLRQALEVLVIFSRFLAKFG